MGQRARQKIQHERKRKDTEFSGVLVRRASIEDLIELTRLFDGYRVFYKQASDVQSAEHFLNERLSYDESVILIAEDERGQGMGFTQLYPLFSSVRMRSIWLLNDLFVDPAHRKKGVGHHLMEAATDFAKSTGAAGLELATAKDNAPAKSVYEDLGWSLDTEFDHYSINVK